jgi:Ran GTPase-activating protein (RanGAP) involved in mRNA processing and transport
VDAALACHVRTLRLEYCVLPDAAAPALARLVGGGALAELDIQGHPWNHNPFLEAPVAGLAHSLRTCSTLTTLKLRDVSFWDDPDAATALLGALAGHASLRTLDLSNNENNATDPVAGAALGALVAANAPALQEVCVHFCELSDAGLGPLFDALPGNTHLRTLKCGVNNLTDAFVRDALLPSVRANGSLRQLSCPQQQSVTFTAAGKQALAEAEALVAQRAAGR